MPGAKRGTLARLRGGAPGIGQLFSIVRELSFDELRDEAQLPPRLLLLGADRALLAALRDALGGGDATHFIEIADFDDLPSHLDSFDGIVLVNAAPSDRNRPAIKGLLNGVETAGRTLTFQLPPSLSRDGQPALSEEAVADLRRRLITRLAHRQLALGRYLPSFRQDAAMGVINATARANAEFAVLSNIPAVVPIVGSVMAIGADFLVLTKNQLMMIYKLAAIHGKDIKEPWRLYTEMLPVVGAGIFWRTVARELASLIPFAAGTIPKLIVAYAGTMVTGQAAHLFYEQGSRPTSDQMKSFYVRAAERAKSLGILQREDDRKVIEGRFTEKAPPPPAPLPEVLELRRSPAAPPAAPPAGDPEQEQPGGRPR